MTHKQLNCWECFCLSKESSYISYCFLRDVDLIDLKLKDIFWKFQLLLYEFQCVNRILLIDTFRTRTQKTIRSLKLPNQKWGRWSYILLFNCFVSGYKKRIAFLDLLLGFASDANNKFTDQDIQDEVNTFMFAVSIHYIAGKSNYEFMFSINPNF